MFSVYGLYCECARCIEKDSTHVRYVGFTSRKISVRLREHMKDQIRTPKTSWIKAHGSENIRYRTLATCDTLQKAIEEEIYWIENLDVYLPFSSVGGLNLTLGGDGTVGREVTDEERVKTSMRASERWRSMDQEGYLSHCLKISEGNRQAWENLTDDEYIERCKNMSDGKRRAREKMTPEQIDADKRSRSVRAKNWWLSLSDEERTAHTEKLKASYASRVQTSDDFVRAQESGRRAAHKRWHETRGVKNLTCSYCIES